jgi:hypothetical protein
MLATSADKINLMARPISVATPCVVIITPLAAAAHSIECLRSDEHSACVIGAGTRIVSVACDLFNKLTIGLKDVVVRAVKVNTVSMISQCLVAHPASHRVTGVVSHQEPNAVLY